MANVLTTQESVRVIVFGAQTPYTTQTTMRVIIGANNPMNNNTAPAPTPVINWRAQLIRKKGVLY